MRTSNVVTILAAAALAAATGCAKYEAKPLSSSAVEQSLAVPDDHALRVAAADLRHPTLKPVQLDPAKGYSPDEVAVLAVIANPDLRAARDLRAAAGAQVLQAGILPNPVLNAAVDVPYFSPTPSDDFTAYNVGVSWDVTSLITRDAKRRAASANAASVDLDIAWKEWQTAEAAKLAAYDVLSLTAQLDAARQADLHLAENFDLVRRAVERHERTLVDLPAAETASRDAHTTVLTLERDLRRQRLTLNRAVGLPPDAALNLRPDPALPEKLTPPPLDDLSTSVDRRRLDLLALKKGYDSQDETLHAAILGQFPKINLGFNAASDTTDVRTVGVGVGIDIPIFDRNQGVIAAETATRQRLFDEYAARLFIARADIATAAEDIRSTSLLVADADASLPSLELLVSTYGAALQRGQADILSYYTARQSLDQKRIEVLKLRQQLVQNWIALEIASGRYLPMTQHGPATAPATQESTR